MGIFLRVLIVLTVWVLAVQWIGDAGDYGRPIGALILFGAIFIVLGPLATEGGFWARGHFVTSGTPGCVWYAAGAICWGIALALIVASKRAV